MHVLRQARIKTVLMDNTCYVGLAYRDPSPRFEERRQDHHRLLRLPLLLREQKYSTSRGQWEFKGSHVFVPHTGVPNDTRTLLSDDF
jgi:hypothetical protein